jgi:hypothetical protein
MAHRAFSDLYRMRDWFSTDDRTGIESLDWPGGFGGAFARGVIPSALANATMAMPLVASNRTVVDLRRRKRLI